MGCTLSLSEGDSILNSMYQILKLIGEGGIARVWLAVPPSMPSAGSGRLGQNPKVDKGADLRHNRHTPHPQFITAAYWTDRAKVAKERGRHDVPIRYWEAE